MPSFLYPLLFCAIVFGLWRLVANWLNQRRRLKAPRITEAELDEFEARLAKAKLPVVRVSLVTEPPFNPAASRVGGPPYADNSRRKWPVRGEDQQPMLFLVQINFAEMPHIEDFPQKGLLQLFAVADKHGHLQETDRKTDRVIRWYPEPEGTITLTPPKTLTTGRKRGTFSERTIQNGLGMQFEVGEAPANPSNWPYNETFPNEHKRLPESEAIKQRLAAFELNIEELLDKDAGRHWIGGHPQFVQDDVRHESRLRKLNRVLLHLASDNTDIRIGDAGELNLMISRKDLRNADFDQAFCTWDCS